MTREQKSQVIENVAEQLKANSHIYVTDTLGLNATDTSNLRRECFNNDIKLIVVRNTLLKKAIEKSGRDLEGLYEVLAGPTAIMLSETGNAPAKLIKEFRKTHEKPILKGAYVEEDVYIGDNQIETLSAIKSKNELIADVIGLLQSPIQGLMGALNSGGNTLTGVLKTLEDRG